MKRIVAFAALIGQAGAFLWHFILIWLYREVIIWEPHRGILIAEMVFVTSLIILAGICLREECLKGR
jgi:hypothetical protein